MTWTLDQKKAARFKFLQALYEETDGSEDAILSMFDIGEKIGIDRESTDKIFGYLQSEGLVKAGALGGIIQITHYGVTEYEEAIENPDNETQYFPPVGIVNNINISGSVVGSQIMQGSTNSQQQQIQTGDFLELRQWLQDLEGKIDGLKLDAQQHAEMVEELDTIKALLGTAKPKRSFLTEGLNTIRSILEGVAGSALATALIASIPQV